MSQKKIVGLLNNLIPEEGIMSDVIKSVDLFRISKSSPRHPQKYEPSIIILAQGKKRVFVGDDIITYDPLHYLVLSVPLPLECETTASPEKPMLGIRIRVDAATIGEIELELDVDDFNHEKISPRGIYSAALDRHLIDSITRLLETLPSSADSRFLGPMIVKEIIYRVVRSEEGSSLRALAFRNQRFFKIAHILDEIHKAYGDKFDLDSLAKKAGMSISSFHSNFKAITNVSPLQYIKNVKLHKAKLLMLETGINAYNAAFQVGYESPSQFNREYKRLFGATPAKDISQP